MVGYREALEAAGMTVLDFSQWGQPAAFLASNHAEPGPNGLLRHKIGPYCLGHGEGTWDLMPGEFS